MKTKKTKIISLLIGLFIIINLSIALKFNPLENKSSLISIFQSAFAWGEDCWNCGGSPCYYVMTGVLCPDKEHTYNRCEPCWSIPYACDPAEQTLCP